MLYSRKALMQYIYNTFTLSSDKLWKLDGTKLLNNANIWASTDKWSFIPEGGMIYIQNTSTNNVLEVNGTDVIPEVKEENKLGQQWSKGKENAEGYFTLENFTGTKFLTATSMISLKTKGQYN